MPLYRRMPRINGFELINRRRWLELNVSHLADCVIPGESAVTCDGLEKLGLFKPHFHDGVRILGDGEIKVKLTVEAHHVTAGARGKIEAAGGKVTLLGPAEAAEA